jgi:hypothetical protein
MMMMMMMMMMMTVNWYGNDKEDGGNGSGDLFVHMCAWYQ